jgi:hypothetical protein
MIGSSNTTLVARNQSCVLLEMQAKSLEGRSGVLSSTTLTSCRGACAFFFFLSFFFFVFCFFVLRNLVSLESGGVRFRVMGCIGLCITSYMGCDRFSQEFGENW